MTHPPLRSRSAPRDWRVRGGALAILFIAVAIVVVVAVVGILYLRPAGAGASPKSVLLITLDTTRADHLGCYGSTTARTPNLDRLAAEGVRFARCMTAAPLTLPSHASIMTGLYPYAHGARLNGTSRLSDGNITLAETLKDAGFQTQATVATVVLNKRYGVSQGFDVYHDVLSGVQTFELEAERKGDEICDDASKMLDELAGKPFFLWVHFFDPHHPYESDRIPDVTSPLAYEDEIAFMDTQIGRLLTHLADLGLDQSTLVIAVGDHGESLGEHGELCHGVLLYDATTHVPLIVRAPGSLPAAKVVDAQVRTIDIAPTVLSWLGLPAWGHAQGVSLMPLMLGESDESRPAYAESLVAENAYDAARLRAWSSGGWKYILSPRPELYELADDPTETHDVIGANAEHAAALRGELRQLIADAPPPPSADDATAHLDSREQAALESLGYIASGSSSSDEGVAELDQFEPSGPNPADHIALFEVAQKEIPQLMDEKRYAEAEVKLREFLAALPNSPQQHMQLAEALQALGRPDEAEAEIQKALEIAPDDYMVRRRLARFLALHGRLEEAREQFAKVLQVVPDDVFSLELMARILQELGQPEAAREHAAAILALEPDHGRALRMMGMLSVQLGQYEEALGYFEHALKVYPDCPGCADAVAKIKSVLGRS